MSSSYSDKNHGRSKAFKIQKSLQKEAANYSFDDDLSDSNTDDIDFTKEIHSIGYYINDREKMIEEMFSVLKGEKLQRILPAMLKGYTIEELKADCLVHLLGMSKKRIFAILEGRDLNTSSDSETEDEQLDNEPEKLDSDGETLEINLFTSEENSMVEEDGEKSQHKSRKRKTDIKGHKKHKKLDSLPIVISDEELIDQKPIKKERRTSKLRKEKNDLKNKILKSSKKLEKRKKTSKVETIEDSSGEETAKSESSPDDDNEDKGKNLLEILELEMRARAIRALLQNTPSDEPVPVSILNIKPESNSQIETEIDKTISEVINEELAPVEECNHSSPTDDVEISEVCDILTVTIDDDEIETLNKEDENILEQNKSTNQQNVSESTCAEEIVESNSKSDNDATKTSDNGMDKSDLTWTDRWIESKGVKEVMKTNKLCANIRKRMRFARMLKQKQSQEQGKETSDLQEQMETCLNDVEESSVAQYNLIKSLDKLKPAEEQPVNSEKS